MSDDLSFESLFGDAELEIECPKCKSKVSFTFKDVGKSITCSKCSTKINLEKDDNFDDTKKNMDKSLDDFKKTLEDF